MNVGNARTGRSMTTYAGGPDKSVVEIPLLKRSDQFDDNEHVVQFYDTDDFLVESVVEFVHSGWDRGERVVVIATESHLSGMRSRLEQTVLSLDEFIQRRWYVPLDVQQLQAEFIANGRLCTANFCAYIDKLFGANRTDERPIRIFGEFVAVLRQQGQPELSLELERLWSRVHQNKKFPLYCAYPLNVFSDRDGKESIKQVCCLHSEVLPVERFSGISEAEEQRLAIALLQQEALSLKLEIAEHRKTEAELRRTENELRLQLAESEEALKREHVADNDEHAANRLTEEFLATISHELRTPLNSIIGWSHMLSRGRLDATTSVRAIKSIERNAKAQAQLVEDLLDVSKISNGKIQLTSAPVDLVEVITSAAESLQLSANSNRIQVDLHLDPTTRPVLGDSERLKQIVWNLLSNAIKFTPSGGHVDVSLTECPTHATIIIADNGEGIRAEFLNCVFDRFRQADASITRRHGGLGLGLALVQRLVKLHGGEVSVESEGEGLGSRVVVKLPVADHQHLAPLSQSSKKHQSHVSSLAGTRILVVDDDADSCQVLKAILEYEGAEVETADSAAVAVSLLTVTSPDVYVIDLAMPREDGFALINKIRKLEQAAGLNRPAVAMTAHVSVEDRARALSGGFDMFVAKPVEADELIEAIGGVLSIAK